ncbi:hypothetical protein Acr_09g0007280 [Actinidia rufa]|uniref:Uncharacterized protein n=1 Tax=Actinidia rufa TaxID=165716 RepID=A0A7J0F6E5_9ERIC|nr:hypothetical protein Acr_09g0007280 [Actinidia rufa]
MPISSTREDSQNPFQTLPYSFSLQCLTNLPQSHPYPLSLSDSIQWGTFARSNANDSAANNTTTKKLEASSCADQSGAGPSPQNSTTPTKDHISFSVPQSFLQALQNRTRFRLPNGRRAFNVHHRKGAGEGPIRSTHLCTNKWSYASGLY